MVKKKRRTTRLAVLFPYTSTKDTSNSPPPPSHIQAPSCSSLLLHPFCPTHTNTPTPSLLLHLPLCPTHSHPFPHFLPPSSSSPVSNFSSRSFQQAKSHLISPFPSSRPLNPFLPLHFHSTSASLIHLSVPPHKPLHVLLLPSLLLSSHLSLLTLNPSHHNHLFLPL